MSSSAVRRFVQLFRVVFPSWKFFDDVFSAPVLWARYDRGARGQGEWREVIPKTGARSPAHLLLNARENDLFARHSLLEQLVADLESGEDASVSRELVENLVRFEAPIDWEKLQYRLTIEGETVYESPVVSHVASGGGR